jgi:uncharacterized protein YeaO (DUF488 family)
MILRLKRAYDPPAATDGTRVLVDRWWPRGLAKTTARIDCWLREIAPSDALCRWFAHDPAKWDGFRRRYARELDGNAVAVESLAALAAKGRVTLLFSARDTAHNNAVALQAYLECSPGAFSWRSKAPRARAKRSG